MANETYLGNVIGFDPKAEEFVVGTHDKKGNAVEASQVNYSVSEVDKLLSIIGASGKREDHEMLAAAIVEPIMQVVPFIESFAPVFLMDQPYSEIEDNRVPVEVIHSIAFEAHPEGGPAYIKAGYQWYRPTFRGPYTHGLIVPWKELKFAGWNFLARHMKRAAEAIARKVDNLAKVAIENAIPAGHAHTVSGGAMTKTAFDAVIKAQAQIGFPVKRVLINAGTIMDMATFVYPVGNFMPEKEQRELLTNLFIKNYAGVDFYINPFVPTNVVYFGGSPDQIGWRQVRGQMTNVSDMDLDRQADKYLLLSPEYACYVQNAQSLATLTITA